MEIRCEGCQGTGKLGFQREDCWFCGGTGYVDNLVYKNNNDNYITAKITEPKSAIDVRYNRDLDAYFKEIKSCNLSNDILLVLSDLYDLIKNKE